MRFDICGGELLTRDVVCPGQWVLMSAMLRTEAGQLHNLGGKTSETRSSDYPWRIEVVQSPDLTVKAGTIPESKKRISEETLNRMKASLQFSYPHQAATQMPSKLTATQLKGRQKDTEAAEHAQEPKQRSRTWKIPSFASDRTDAAAKGTAVHTAMQHLDYKRCGSRAEIEQEIRRLVEQRFLTQQQSDAVETGWIEAFFRTPLGSLLRSGAAHIREFKFSILDDASKYGDNLEEEKVLLQGVVDCAIMEEDGITMLDFKTDYVTDQTLEDVSARYRHQVETYGRALARIYRKPVKASYLYFFRLNRFVKM